ncbi:TonB-dependent receptor [Massilia sp. TWP1-3-3]|uniref:TonB-dependent receptor n=1 Tax=Massilia sp. TWP1-3-3 TaxID=2804573 RepID=UPI003CEAB022
MLRKSVLVRALSLAFSAAALSAAVVQPAMAQSNAAGTIYGNVEGATGATVVVRNLETNLQRRATPDASGRYTVTALPVGRYKVDVMKGDTVVKTSEVDVLLGQGVDASASVSGVQTVRVTGGRKRIDVSNTNNGAVFSAKELAKLPIRPTVDAIIQLAPNTTRADDRYAGASFGGAGASENAYYINGFPVTNPITGLGSSELPFGAVAQAQILTGGFGAEFGRSIGGVVNITTKGGTNTWEAGGMVSVEPSRMRAKYKDFHYADTGFYPATAPDVNANGFPTTNRTDGLLRTRREDNERQEVRVGAFVGGPIIKDKLFMFVAAEQNRVDRDIVSRANNGGLNAISKWGFGELKDTITRYVAKVDWNLTDNHRLEFLSVGDNSKLDAEYYGYNYNTRARGSVVNSGEHYRNDPATTQGVGGDFNQLKYTGNLTENLTLTAMHGKLTSEHSNTFDGYDVYNLASAVPQVSSLSVCPPSLPCVNNQPLTGTIMPKGGKDTVKNTRLDLEWKVGAHTLRVGADKVELLNENTGFITAGGSIWRYYKQANPTVAQSLSSTGAKVAVATKGSGPLAAQGYWARQEIFSSATPVGSEQTSQFIEDKWQVSKNVLLSLGLRNEQFKNINGDGETFLEMKNQISPRLGASWDVNGDASLKVFGTAGRYYLQVPGSIGVRGAARSLFTRQGFSYTGMDANGAPTGLVKLTEPFSTNNEYNQAKDPLVVSALKMKPNFQDEMTVGFEKAYSPSLNFGVKATYRKLKSTLDDLCDARPFEEYFAAHPTLDTSKYGGFGCATFNPGEDNTFLVDLNDTDPALARKTYTTVKLTAAQIGLPMAKRVYKAVDVFAEHPLRNGWYGRVNYTLSRSEGNTEGQTRSDNAQANPGATTTWDTRELPEYTYGRLPNDRKHQIKAFGFWEVSPTVTLGGNALLASGRPKSCFGNHPTVDPSYDYGSNYHYCGGGLSSAANKPTPRGSLGELPKDVRFDMNVAYRPLEVKGLTLRMDVFNLFDRQVVQRVDETYNSGPNVVAPEYNRIQSYSNPRAFRFTAEYSMKF